MKNIVSFNFGSLVWACVSALINAALSGATESRTSPATYSRLEMLHLEN